LQKINADSKPEVGRDGGRKKVALFAPPSDLPPPLPLSPPDKIESKNDNKGEVWRERGKVVGPKTTRATIEKDNDVIPGISPPARRGLFEFDSDCADQKNVKQDIGSHVMDMVEGTENQDVDRNLRVNDGERDEQGMKDVLELEDVGRERTASNEEQAVVVHLKDVVFERVAGKKEHGQNVANIELLLDMHIAQIGRSELKRAEFKREVADDVMRALGSNAEKCHAKGIRAGSVIVDLEIELAHGVAPKVVLFPSHVRSLSLFSLSLSVSLSFSLVHSFTLFLSLRIFTLFHTLKLKRIRLWNVFYTSSR
jgi:hypothetical protein